MSDESRKVPPASPPIDFYTFCVSLGSSAFVHLGDAPHPETGETTADLALAKQTIDILGMLEEKTRGNLSEEEASFLRHLLVDLRLRYVGKTSGRAE